MSPLPIDRWFRNELLADEPLGIREIKLENVPAGFYIHANEKEL